MWPSCIKKMVLDLNQTRLSSLILMRHSSLTFNQNVVPLMDRLSWLSLVLALLNQALVEPSVFLTTLVTLMPLSSTLRSSIVVLQSSPTSKLPYLGQTWSMLLELLWMDNISLMVVLNLLTIMTLRSLPPVTQILVQSLEVLFLFLRVEVSLILTCATWKSAMVPLR